MNGYDPPVGSVLLAPLPDGDGEDTDDIEIGWELHPGHWGKGYATEAAQLILDLAWGQGLAGVNAVALPGNDRSLTVMRRLGFEPK